MKAGSCILPVKQGVEKLYRKKVGGKRVKKVTLHGGRQRWWQMGRAAENDTEREGCTTVFSTFSLNANIEFKWNLQLMTNLRKKIHNNMLNGKHHAKIQWGCAPFLSFCCVNLNCHLKNLQYFTCVAELQTFHDKEVSAHVSPYPLQLERLNI